MTKYSWKSAVGGSWGNAALWTPAGGPPNATTADATIANAGSVTIALGSSYTVDSLSLTDSGAELSLLGTLKLSGTSATLALQSGTIVASGTIQGGTLALTGGTFEVANSLAYSGGFLLDGNGQLSLDAGKTLTLSGAPTLNGVIFGGGTLATTGAASLLGGYLYDTSTLRNSGTVLQTGGFRIYDTGTIVNAATWNITNDSDIVNSTDGTFTNTGLFEKTAGTTSSVDASFSNTGTIAVKVGTLSFYGGGSFGGSITGAGTIEFGYYTGVPDATLAAGVSLTVAKIVVYRTLGFANSLAYSGGFLLDGNGQLSLDAGKTLTLSGAPTLNGVIFGGGTLATTGAASLLGGYLYDTSTLRNSGTVLQTGGFRIYDTGTIVNAATWNITNDSDIVNSTNGTFTNTGLFEKTAGTTSSVDASFSNTGTIAVKVGTLSFYGGGSFGGSITGAGTIEFGYYTGVPDATLAAGVSLTVAKIVVYRTLGFANSLAYSGGFLLDGNGQLSLDAGKTLTLSGAPTLNGVIFGGGTLATTGAASLLGGYLYDTSTLRNSGTVLQTGGFRIYDTGTIVNAATWNITNDSDIVNSTDGTFTNTGLFEKTAGTTSSVDASFSNTGTIAVKVGTLSFYGGGSFGGSITGAGTIEFGYYTGVPDATLAAGVSLTVAKIVVYRTLGFANSLAYSGGFLLDGNGQLSLDAGKTLTLSGAPTLNGVIFGGGTLATTGAASLLGGYLYDTSTLRNSGTVLQTGGFRIYDTGTIVNAATWNITNDSDIVNSTNGTFTNTGLFEKTAGTTSSVDASFSNTGTIAVKVGTLSFYGGGSFGGSITGAGTIEFGYYTGVPDATLAAGVSLTVAKIVVYRTLGFANSLAYSGGFLLDGNGQLSLDAGKTLTLSGAPTLNGVIFGGGTLATTGAASLLGGYLYDTSTLRNSGTVLQTGGFRIYDTGTIVNAATWNITNDSDIVNSTNGTFTNTGLFEKTAGTTSSVDASFSNTGTILVAAGTLDLPALTNLSGTTLTGGKYSVSNGATLQLANNFRITTLAAGVTLSGSTSAIHSLDTNTNSQVGIESTVSTVTSAGALRIVGGRSFTAVANSGTFTLAGILQLGGGTFDATKLNVAATTTILGYGIVKPAVGSVALLDAVNGGTLALTGSVSTAASLRADINSVLQLNQAAITSVSRTITLTGAGSTIQFGTSTFTALESTLASIAATGTLSVLGNRGYVTTKAFTDSGLFNVGGGTITAGSLTVAAGARVIAFATFTNAVSNSGTIEAAGGLLKLAAGASGSGTLLVDASSTLELAGVASAGTLLVNGRLKPDGQATTASHVTISSTGRIDGFGSFLNALVNNGTIDAHGGLLKTGAVTGTGTLRIENASTLELTGAAAQTVTFSTGAVGSLALDAQASFSGLIQQLALGDALVLKNELVSSAVISGSTLAVVGSAGTVDYQVAGALTGNHFAIGADQHTLTLVHT